MRSKSLSHVVAAIGLLLVLLQFTSCGSGSDDGGCSVPSNFEGDWYCWGEVTDLSLSEPDGECFGYFALGDPFEAYVTLEQPCFDTESCGTTLLVSGDIFSEGTVCGNSIDFTVEYCNGDICVEDQYSLDLYQSETGQDVAIGTAQLFTTDGISSCTATVTVYAIRPPSLSGIWGVTATLLSATWTSASSTTEVPDGCSYGEMSIGDTIDVGSPLVIVQDEGWNGDSLAFTVFGDEFISDSGEDINGLYGGLVEVSFSWSGCPCGSYNGSSDWHETWSGFNGTFNGQEGVDGIITGTLEAWGWRPGDPSINCSFSWDLTMYRIVD